jgi:hypothetical protein
MDISVSLVSGFVGFTQNLVGIVVKPYESYRRIIKSQNIWELGYIALLLIVYFATASMVKTAAFRPFLLTKQFVILGSAVASMTLVISYIFWQISVWFKGVGKYSTFAIGWAYTLIPTLLWFWITSILYIVLPPPRTTSPLGVIFSVIYLIFSATLFYWKIILCYLTLRFSMRMDLKSIILTVVSASPLIVGYSYLMYKLNIFKVPFI